ncbi:MAG: Lysophospholipase [Verrucomicrobiaceae bacterium]|nr:Lysophospholipase [Verrucomicrobiaceae bacterium]
MLRLSCLSLLLTAVAFAETPKAAAPIPGPEKWEKSIAAFEAADKTMPPPVNGIEFVGSSTMVKWKTLKEDFAGLPVFNRGFGGSQSSDVLFYLDRVVLAYKPKAIVFYAGDNDLGLGKKAEDVIDTWKKIMARLTTELPDTKIIYLSLRPSIKRLALFGEQQKTNAGIKASIEGKANVQFIDLTPALVDKEGKPNGALLVADKLHLNADGYKVLTGIVKPLLK